MRVLGSSTLPGSQSILIGVSSESRGRNSTGSGFTWMEMRP